MKTERLGMSEKAFSRDWLGMSVSYWAYIKSAKANPSAECLLRLYGRLKHQKQIHEYQLSTAKTEIQRYFINDGLALYASLAEKAHTAIEEYSLQSPEHSQ